MDHARHVPRRICLRTLQELDLIESVAPIQLAIRLLIPAGSLLLELEDLGAGAFDPAALVYRWTHKDPEMDRLCEDVSELAREGGSRSEIFRQIWERAFGSWPDFMLRSGASVPYLTEPWYC